MKNKITILREDTIREIKYLIEQECASRNLGREHGISLDDMDRIFLPKSDEFDDQASNFVTGVVNNGIINYEGDCAGFIPFEECSTDVLGEILAGIELEKANGIIEMCNNPFYIPKK